MIFRIASTEGCQQRLRSELQTLSLSTPTTSVDGLAPFDELVKLPYLNACINEGYRTDPIIGISLSRRVPPGGATLCGFDIPEGVSPSFRCPSRPVNTASRCSVLSSPSAVQ
jgi:hypothetical protein